MLSYSPVNQFLNKEQFEQEQHMGFSPPIQSTLEKCEWLNHKQSHVSSWCHEESLNHDEDLNL